MGEIKPKIIIGIDPGSSNGGIAVWKNKAPVVVANMPKNENIGALRDFLAAFIRQSDDIVVFIEKVQMFHSDTEENRGKQYRIKVMLANYERIISLLIFLGIKYVEVYPISWQSTLKLRKKGLEKKARKALYKEYAKNAFPEIKVTLRNSDALCLIQFALTKYEKDVNWINSRIQNDKKNNLF